MSTIMLNLLAVTDGGQVTRASEFLNIFRNYDSESSLVVLRRKGTLPFCDLIENTKIIDVEISNSIFRPWFRLFWENINLRFIVKNIQPEIYISFSHYLPTSIDKSVTSIIGVTNLAPFTPLALSKEKFTMKVKMKILRYSIISSAKKATHVIALSKLCKSILINHGIKSKNITVINNGVNNTNNDSTISPIDSYSIESNFILYVSSFFHYKNFEILIKSYGILSKKMINNYQLVLIGRVHDESYYKDLKVLVRKLNIEDRVVFIPEIKREELVYFYKNTTLFIFPSLIENCPNILLEALSFGCPILCSSAKPMPEFGGSAVSYFNPHSVSSLHRIMVSTINNQNILSKMKNMSLNRSKVYSWNLFTKSVVDLIKEVS